MFAAFAALLVTIGALVLSLRFLAKLQGVTPRGAQGATLEVMERVATGPRQGVVLLRAGDRLLVVGTGDSHTTLLGELDGAVRDGVFADARAARPAGRSGASPLGRFGAKLGLALALVALPVAAHAQTITAPKPGEGVKPAATAPVPGAAGPNAPQVGLTVGSAGQQFKLEGAVGVVVLMGAMTLLPAMFMLMTGFTRILIVLSFLRSAIGTQTAPPTQLLVAIAVILTSVVMRPVLDDANRTALQPYLRGEIGQVEAYKAVVKPLRGFMLANTRDRDLATFIELSGSADAGSMEEVPTMTIVSAFVASELRTAFQMGFVIFLPFLIIDLIVSSVLMSMGMFMLPPVMVSLPFKLLLFVLADGWVLVMQNLVGSFRTAAA